jgi:hypothetical protein
MLMSIDLYQQGTTMPTPYLRLTDGTIAFDDQGQGPLVLREQWGYLCPPFPDTSPGFDPDGLADPDFKSPEQEAHTLAGRLPYATTQIIEGAGHHPQVEEPELVGQSILAFLARCADPKAAGS